jgi:glycosyltransferase involved in cell wall biosynthesis
MTVSIIIRTFNRPGLLIERAVRSVFAQTDPDWECHVIGDGTDDETAALMAATVRVDRRFRFTALPRQQYPEGDRWNYWGLLGLEALNYGLDTAKGDWIAVLDDDDEFRPAHNEVLRKVALQHDVDFVYGISVSPQGQRWGAWPPGDGQITQGSYLYRGRARDYRYDLNCLRDRGLNGDADLWTRMYAEGVRFKMIGTVVHHYFPSSDRGGS